MLPNLKKLRAEAGISQQRLADAIGVSQPSINKYENHNIEPDIAILCSIADYFRTSVDYLIGHTEIRQKIEPTHPHELNDEEMAFIEGFRALNSEEKRCIQMTIDVFNGAVAQVTACRKEKK